MNLETNRFLLQINLDFEQQYPDKLNNMLVSWEKFIDKIMTYYEDNKIKDKQSLQLLDLTKLENISTGKIKNSYLI